MIERATDVATALWKRFRATRAFLPSLVLVPALIVALTGWGMYASWDSTRVDIPNTVGLTLPEGEEAMRGLGVSLTAIEVLDDAIAESCYVVSSQSLEPGTRVVPEDTTVELGVELSVREVASVVDMSLAQATSKLLEGCLHASVSTTWCLPDDFSGTDESLESPAFTPETGFRFDSVTRQLRHSSLVAEESWIVCDQSIRAATEAEAGSTVELSLYPRLTTVPAVGGNVSDVVSALDMTADAAL